MFREVTVIGSTNIDMTMQLERLPKKGETVTGGEYYQALGGKGANQAVSAARCGAHVNFITSLGNDHYTSLLIDSFLKSNINTQFVFVEDTSFTGTAIIMTDKDGENYIGVAPGANDYLTPEKIDKAISAIVEADVVLLQYEIPKATIEHVIDICSRLDKKLIFNLAPAQPIEDTYLAKVHTLVVNETEAAFLSGMKITNLHEIEEASRSILAKGPTCVIITLGSEGCYVCCHNESFLTKGFEVDAVDTTGAGDVFCGALAVAYTEEMKINEAISFATAAAAISVTRMGAQPSAPRREEIIEFLRNHH
jgi:ribokinase